jgi:hypothetical protein
MKNFRKLKKNEIQVRVEQCKTDKNNTSASAIYLLYKDARCDMAILDETVGAENWKREHSVVNNNLFCKVSIYNESIKEWISKEDVGVESYSEKEKGQASDSFKRACVNWGIGRELYTAPFIYVKLTQDQFKVNSKGAVVPTIEPYVSEIAYNDDGEIVKLELTDRKTQDVIYTYGMPKKAPKQVKEEPKKEVKKDLPLASEESCNELKSLVDDDIIGKILIKNNALNLNELQQDLVNRYIDYYKSKKEN